MGSTLRPLITNNVPVITFDGPAGTGKGTMSQLVAAKLGFNVLDSGALYRILAYNAVNRGTKLSNERELVTLVNDLRIEFRVDNSGGPLQIVVDEKDISADIRTEICGSAASAIAVFEGVREALLKLQHQFCCPPGLVADGRDMGTVVFPGALAKFFLVATPEKRAGRRHKQLKAKGISVNLLEILAQIKERDRRDIERTAAPLKPAEDAVVVDTTELSIKGVYQKVMSVVLARGVGIA